MIQGPFIGPQANFFLAHVFFIFLKPCFKKQGEPERLILFSPHRSKLDFLRQSSEADSQAFRLTVTHKKMDYCMRHDFDLCIQ